MADPAARRQAWRLALVVVGMFGFGYALVPLYNVVCEVTGLNGKTSQVDAEEAAAFEPDLDRLVTVEFVTGVKAGLPWAFEPRVRSMQVHPGQMYEASFVATNRSTEPLVGQAVPSVAPGEAARHFQKTECFCFTKQRFEAGETRELPLRFVIDPRLPRHLKTVTLSYTFFDVTSTAKADTATTKTQN
jgi:cytochrome c oxidase assembly protein subunit 11